MLPVLFTDIKWLDNLLQLVFAIIIFAFVLFLTYLAARIAGTYQSNIMNKRSNIRVIETYRLANNKYIQIVRISGKYLALGIGKDMITLLAELEEENIKDISAMPMEKLDFKAMLSKVRKDKDEKDTFPKDEEK
ncbi:MAG: flagellar biosynthetic protein FliO [Lachnospiraceae bacterium]|nr:flagellar biosynthetic protein FliO [Lachnospiraceae bacterium]